jgi:hypothetical protein
MIGEVDNHRTIYHINGICASGLFCACRINILKKPAKRWSRTGKHGALRCHCTACNTNWK